MTSSEVLAARPSLRPCEQLWESRATTIGYVMAKRWAIQFGFWLDAWSAVNKKRSTDAGLMLDQRPRRWPNINPGSNERPAFSDGHPVASGWAVTSRCDLIRLSWICESLYWSASLVACELSNNHWQCIFIIRIYARNIEDNGDFVNKNIMTLTFG